MKPNCAFNKNKEESISFSSKICYLTIVFTKGNKLALTVLGVFMLMIGVTCRGLNKYDVDKQNSFLVKFTGGMSKQEVDAILQNHPDITLLEEYQENNELVVKYITPIEIYGSNIFIFVYSPEMNLKYVIPLMPMD